MFQKSLRAWVATLTKTFKRLFEVNGDHMPSLIKIGSFAEKFIGNKQASNPNPNQPLYLYEGWICSLYSDIQFLPEFWSQIFTAYCSIDVIYLILTQPLN